MRGAAAFYGDALGLATSVLEENPGRGWRAELPTGHEGLSIADTVELADVLGIPEYLRLDGQAPAPCSSPSWPTTWRAPTVAASTPARRA